MGGGEGRGGAGLRTRQFVCKQVTSWRLGTPRQTGPGETFSTDGPLAAEPRELLEILGKKMSSKHRGSERGRALLRSRSWSVEEWGKGPQCLVPGASPRPGADMQGLVRTSVAGQAGRCHTAVREALLRTCTATVPGKSLGCR